jgi:SAM-dependent methyltransferase
VALQDVTRFVKDAVGWRMRSALKRFKASGASSETAWVRVEMNKATAAFVDRIGPAQLDALEIGGENWKERGFQSYTTIDYPEYDLCDQPYREEAFDLIVLEQVLEHVLWPYRAVHNIFRMLRPGGWAMVTTPFLVKIHAYPIDCSRWTEMGLKHLLAEGGFDVNLIQTGSWGNRQAVTGGFAQVPRYRSWQHSLHNEPNFPVMVWAFAQRPDVDQ